jgi:hypothetical protein
MRIVVASLAAVFALSSATSFAQESKSAPLARQLASALDSAKLDSVAAADPVNAGTFVAALYIANSQLLVVSAKFPAPQIMIDRIAKKEYRDAYIDLNSASVLDSKVFIEDLGADGLKVKREENQPFDAVEAGGKRTAFDGEWKKQKISEQDYMKAFSAGDERYTEILTILLAQVKKTS